MDLLYDAAATYGELTGCEHRIALSDGRELRLIFKPANFAHLAGLHKFDDLYWISSGKYGAVQLYKMALRGKLTLEDLKKSRKYTAEARERLESLLRISELLVVNGRAVSPFDRSVCRAQVRFKSDTLFFKDDGYEFFITFGAAREKQGIYHYPETVFYRFDRAYILHQRIVTIHSIERIQFAK